MTKIITTGQVEDAAEWESEFRTHVDLFRKYTATQVRFATTAENEIAIVWEVDDVDTYLRLLEAPETIQAMESDGVKRDTVKVFVLDKEVVL